MVNQILNDKIAERLSDDALMSVNGGTPSGCLEKLLEILRDEQNQ